jgi:probable phosphoglycerate mutase
MIDRVRATACCIIAHPTRSLAIFTHGQIMQAWRLLADNPGASDKEDMTDFPTTFQARPFDNCEWRQGVGYRKMTQS